MYHLKPVMSSQSASNTVCASEPTVYTRKLSLNRTARRFMHRPTTKLNNQVMLPLQILSLNTSNTSSTLMTPWTSCYKVSTFNSIVAAYSDFANAFSQELNQLVERIRALRTNQNDDGVCIPLLPLPSVRRWHSFAACSPPTRRSEMSCTLCVRSPTSSTGRLTG